MDALKLKKLNHTLNEPTLIQRILAGESELYEILLRRNNQKLYRVIRGYVRDTPEVEDIMQNTYLKAYEKLYQFKHTSNYSTWLIRIGINEALAHLRERDRIYQLHDVSDNFEKNVISDSPNPEKKIILKETKHLIESVIDSLESKYRTVYLMKEVEEMSTAEISECLSISTSNVKVRLHRAKSMIKDKIYSVTKHKQLFEFGFSKCDRITENVMKMIL